MANLRTILARVKRNILKKPFIKDPSLPAFWFDKKLSTQSAFIVQIGSNDGKTGDPIFPLLQKNKSWKALFVEPVPYSFEKLKANYPNEDRFSFENVAINQGEPLTFYWVDHSAKSKLPDLPYWFDQLGSFNRQHILNHFDGALEPFIRSEVLEGLTLPQLLERNKVEKINILHIDTEGYDWKILQQLDLNKYQSDFILMEYNHLSKDELSQTFSFLKDQYRLFNLGIDMLAVHKEVGQDLMKGIAKSMTPLAEPKI